MTTVKSMRHSSAYKANGLIYAVVVECVAAVLYVDRSRPLFMIADYVADRVPHIFATLTE